MTIMIVASEIKRGGSIPRRFVFDIDDGKGFCYRSRTSSNAFFHSLKQRNWRGGKELNNYDVLYHSQSLQDFQWHVEHFRSALAQVDKPLPEGYDTLIELPNLWEFYKAIGWDYKTKKWSK